MQQHVNAVPCNFEDGGVGVSVISELDIPPFEADQVRHHVLTNALVPSQNSAGGTTVLFDTPTKGVDASMEVSHCQFGAVAKTFPAPRPSLIDQHANSIGCA